nr:MAG TPA: hypothetical protein [Caudoviricetes sp.]
MLFSVAFYKNITSRVSGVKPVHSLPKFPISFISLSSTTLIYE